MANENNVLNGAKKNKKDEFYTQLEDIERECNHYISEFKDKVIYCNCDNPLHSKFWEYFYNNFHKFGLKELISTYYGENAKVTIYNGKGIKSATLLNGSFDSEECIELLKESDIVITNPPFSLFRKFVSTLIDYEKKFLIIGNQNAITYRELFPYIKNNQMWLGYGFKGNVGFFKSPYEDNAMASQHKEGLIRVSGVMWFTNLPCNARNEFLPLEKTYNAIEYPNYDTINAINVNKTVDIPCDYNGIMGVPITFMTKYNPKQFEIVGKIDTGKIDNYNLANPIVNNKTIYKRIAIRKK